MDSYRLSLSKPRNNGYNCRIGPESTDHRNWGHIMSILQELLTLIDSLDEDVTNYQNVRAIKRIAHHLEKITENLEAGKA